MLENLKEFEIENPLLIIGGLMPAEGDGTVDPGDEDDDEEVIK